MKIRGRISGQTILLDTLPGLPMDQRVEVDITPVEDATETAKVQRDEASAREPARKRKRGGRFAEMGISQEELEVRIATEPRFEFIRRADEHRKKMARRREGKSDITTQWIREDRDR